MIRDAIRGAMVYGEKTTTNVIGRVLFVVGYVHGYLAERIRRG